MRAKPSTLYEQNLQRLQKELKNLKQKKSALGWFRFGSVIAIGFVFYLLWGAGAIYVIGGTLILLSVFIYLVKRDLANLDQIKHTKILIEINELELEALAGNYSGFYDGADYSPKEHEYAGDLDMLGRASIFQFLNRTTSQPGAKTLSDHLLKAASLEEITLRQLAGNELSKKVAWMQNFMAEGKKQPLTFYTIRKMNKWMQEPAVFSNFKPWKVLRYLLPAVIISVVTLFFAGIASETVFYVALFVFAAIAYRINKYVAPVHEILTDVAREMRTLRDTIILIENENFESELLQQLQKTFIKSKRASGNINQLSKILERLDLRYNFMLSAPLNLLLLWNLQQMLDLEKWKANEQMNLAEWFAYIGEIEALISFAVLHVNEPGWVYPDVVPDYFTIHGTQVGHPLIPVKKRVSNPVQIEERGKITLLTGSNMAGKSTYLRSVGVNVVLALAGAPVCAASFSVSHIRLMTSMRIADNLEESTSTFYAELKKLKAIIEQVKAGERVFILLDEILRGTNSFDRHTGSKALMKQFIKERTAAIIATHDLELARLTEIPQQILNYHFDVQVENEELFFDYKLKEGICNSLNASILMRKIGIEL